LSTPPLPDSRPAHPTFREAFWYWLKLGFISFGGPAGQIAIMHQELVEKRRWISEQRFLHALNYCMVLPGPEAQQLAIYIGWLLHRTWGGIVAGVLFVLPSLFILSALSYIYLVYGDVGFVQAIFNGVKPAVVAIVIFAAWRIGTRALKNPYLWGLAALSFIAIFVFKVYFPYIVIGAGILGFIGGKLAPKVFQIGGHHGSSNTHYGLAVIDSDTPTLPHTRFRWPYVITLGLVALTMWASVMAALSHPVLLDMGKFFTKAALLTFGGAYAVLPYVYQGGVEQYQWLTAKQMMDGLALGEATPGPLIMVVSFVGFIGAWSKEILGPDALVLAGFLGATVATFFTFLPSFVFILAGAPLVESTHGNINFTAPLTGITAAVVGVIVNLALFFAYHVLWPLGFEGPFDPVSALICVTAAIALFRFKRGVIETLFGCAGLGLAIQFLTMALT